MSRLLKIALGIFLLTGFLLIISAIIYCSNKSLNSLVKSEYMGFFIFLLVLLLVLLIVLIFMLRGSKGQDNNLASGNNRFYQLYNLDNMESSNPTEKQITLKEVGQAFRNFAASKLSLYYDEDTINTFIASLGVSNLIILEGLSGMGKTSLAYSFGKFVSNEARVIPVEPTWKEKTDLLGYYNDFTNRYHETDLLVEIYEANLNDKPYVAILDEMNIARVEYYFADILSLLELPKNMKRRISIVGDVKQTDPKLLENGSINLPSNLYFIGTANNDDSTFAISDKVYDRAMVISFDKINEPFIAPSTNPIEISYSTLNRLYEEAINEYKITKRSLNKINELEKYLRKNLNITFGNRVLEQMMKFTSIYMALGYDELEGVDVIISSKVLRHLDKEGTLKLKRELPKLKEFINKVFDEGMMTKSILHIDKILNEM